MSAEPEMLIERRGPLVLVTLNRPKALNALSRAMCLELLDQLGSWDEDPGVAAMVIRGAGERAFCAGGDVVAIYQSARGDGRAAAEFFHAEYRMNRALFHFSKPVISLVDGLVMGGGVGISAHGSHWVATERTLFAMPETGIGLFPDVGGSYFLPRLPDSLGTYLGLTGARIKAADCRFTGIASDYVEAARMDALVEALAAADWSDDLDATATQVLSQVAADPGPAPLAEHGAAIARCFSQDTVAAILAALEAEGSAWAEETRRGLLERCSPTSLKLTLRQLRQGLALDFDQAMVMEYRLARACVAGHDLAEGIRAAVIDKDRAPKWRPATLDAVTEEMVAAHFSPRDDGDLTFD